MKDSEGLASLISSLMDKQKLAVVATQNQGQPYTSLVAFVASKDLQYLFFATPQTTRKYANMRSDSRVSLMIDSRSNQDLDFHQAMAITAVGSAETLEKGVSGDFLDRYLKMHPYLEDFIKSPTCAWIRVTITHYYLVKNFQNVTELEMKS
jgi:general stress protein 26